MISWSELAAEGKKLMEGGDTSFTDAEIINDEMSELLFTSGTTGIAKGVMLSHKNICLIDDSSYYPQSKHMGYFLLGTAYTSHL